MSLCFKEKTVSKPRKGKALISELKEDLFPGPRAHRSQRDRYTEMHLPSSASPSVRPEVDTGPVNQDRWWPIWEISDLRAEKPSVADIAPILQMRTMKLRNINYLSSVSVLLSLPPVSFQSDLPLKPDWVCHRPAWRLLPPAWYEMSPNAMCMVCKQNKGEAYSKLSHCITLYRSS
uniref:Uncharacterized protein n=1 Tax=Myotis myotis TaxID=51298 RepID=A0A7J7TIL3_MYOMY|nr:hypothetical protein mMyoMyo1_009043 [Myotis myotis]